MNADRSQPRILIVDDEPHIVDVVEYVLREQGCVVATAADSESALHHLQAGAVDLLILDLGLPGMSGLDLLRRLREIQPALPVIILSARSEEIDRVVGLELGADDYVTKPFSAREVAARVRAVLRRATGNPATTPAGIIIHGPLRVDPEALTASVAGQPLTLTRAEFRLLECLVRHPARIFTRESLIDRLYDGAHPVTDRSVDACIKRLRRKFADIRADLDPIQTVHGLGYKLNAELEGHA